MIKIINQSLPKIQVTRLPFVDFGVSSQSPDYFHSSHSMISSHSYNNPFIKIDKFNISKIVSRTTQLKTSLTQLKANQQSQPQWTSRIHLSNFSNLKNENGFLTGRKDQSKIAAGLNHSIEFDQTFQNIVIKQDNVKYFHKKKGEFTTYLQNHLLNNDFSGPMLGYQRSPQRNKQTKQRILQKQLQTLQMTKNKYSKIKPNRSLSPLLQKTKIHRSRLRLNEQVHQTYKQKQNIKQKIKQFELPKINRNQLEDSLYELKSNYKKYKNDNLTKSFFISSLSNVKTAQFDKSGILNNTRKIR